MISTAAAEAVRPVTVRSAAAAWDDLRHHRGWTQGYAMDYDSPAVVAAALLPGVDGTASVPLGEPTWYFLDARGEPVLGSPATDAPTS